MEQFKKNVINGFQKVKRDIYSLKDRILYFEKVNDNYQAVLHELKKLKERQTREAAKVKKLKTELGKSINKLKKENQSLNKKILQFKEKHKKNIESVKKQLKGKVTKRQSKK